MGLMILISFLPKTSGDVDPLNLVNSSFVYYVNKFTNYNEINSNGNESNYSYHSNYTIVIRFLSYDSSYDSYYVHAKVYAVLNSTEYILKEYDFYLSSENIFTDVIHELSWQNDTNYRVYPTSYAYQNIKYINAIFSLWGNYSRQFNNTYLNSNFVDNGVFDLSISTYNNLLLWRKRIDNVTSTLHIISNGTETTKSTNSYTITEIGLVYTNYISSQKFGDAILLTLIPVLSSDICLHDPRLCKPPEVPDEPYYPPDVFWALTFKGYTHVNSGDIDHAFNSYSKIFGKYYSSPDVGSGVIILGMNIRDEPLLPCVSCKYGDYSRYRDDFFRSAIYEQYCGVPYSWIRIFAHFQSLSHSDAYEVNYIAHTYCSETTSYIQMGSVIIPPYAHKIITVLMVCPKSI
jgi:hypothetical protein